MFRLWTDWVVTTTEKDIIEDCEEVEQSRGSKLAKTLLTAIREIRHYAGERNGRGVYRTEEWVNGAENEYRARCERAEIEYGANHPIVSMSVLSYAVLLHQNEKHREAVKEYSKALELLGRVNHEGTNPLPSWIREQIVLCEAGKPGSQPPVVRATVESSLQ